MFLTKYLLDFLSSTTLSIFDCVIGWPRRFQNTKNQKTIFANYRNFVCNRSLRFLRYSCQGKGVLKERGH